MTAVTSAAQKPQTDIRNVMTIGSQEDKIDKDGDVEMAADNED